MCSGSPLDRQNEQFLGGAPRDRWSFALAITSERSIFSDRRGKVGVWEPRLNGFTGGWLSVTSRGWLLLLDIGHENNDEELVDVDEELFLTRARRTRPGEK